MRKHLLHTLICLLALQQGLLAQAGNSTTPEFGLATPRNMWEIGLHGGYFFVAGGMFRRIQGGEQAFIFAKRRIISFRSGWICFMEN